MTTCSPIILTTLDSDRCCDVVCPCFSYRRKSTFASALRRSKCAVFSIRHMVQEHCNTIAPSSAHDKVGITPTCMFFLIFGKL